MDRPQRIAVYTLTHLPTRKFYVGSTASLLQRQSGHHRNLIRGTHDNPRLQELYQSTPNIELFVFTHLDFDDRDAAFEYEQTLLTENRNNPLLLNIALNARASTLGRPRSEQIKAKISISKTGVPKSEDWKASIRGVNNPKSRAVYIDSVGYGSLGEASSTLGIPKATLRYRLCNGNFPSYRYEEESH